MNKYKSHGLSLHIAVFLFGLSGVIAKSLGLSSWVVTLGRVFFSVLFLAILIKGLKKSLVITSKRQVVIAGILLAVHWTTFFEAIRLGNVAIGTLTFATYPMFTAFLEPVFFKEAFKIKQVYQAIFIVIGVGVMVKGASFNSLMMQGVAWGMVSSITYAFLSLYNRALSMANDSMVIAFLQQVVAGLILLPNIFLIPVSLSPLLVGKLMILGVVCTGVAHTLFIWGLKSVTAHAAGVISGLEPVYGILLAFLLLGEAPNDHEILGGGIILVTIMCMSLYREKSY